MNLKLNIYTDETLTELKRVVEADRLRIPYRVAIYIGQTLETLDFKNNESVLKLITSNLDKLDKIIKATFGVSEQELECIDTLELGNVGVELFNWAMEKFNSVKGNDQKNG